MVRALISTWVGAEREHLSTRYLWLLALEDWTAGLVLATTGAVFVITLDALGIWSVAVAAMTYAFGYLALLRANQSRSTYVQMIRALAQISEVADLAPRGHSVRTAELAVAVARDMGLHPDDVVDLEYAALMHDVGRITLTEPALTSSGYTDADIALRGAEIIAEAPHLEAVAGYVRLQHHPYRRPGEATDPDVPTVSKIIKVASAYDQAVHEMHMSPLESLERIHRGSAYDFDPTVAASLRRVLVRRRVIAA
jgi:HD-GYP domain-containing protein (c-di-GMP phosphodiesterase class II)